MDEGGLVTCTLPVNKWVDATTAKRWHTMANEDLIDEHVPFDSSERSEEELIDHLIRLQSWCRRRAQ